MIAFEKNVLWADLAVADALKRALLGLLWVIAWQAAAVAEDWPQFRGPDGQGHSSDRGLPLFWSESENIAWKVPIPGRGWSSPVIAGDQIWLTTALDDGRSLRALCLQRDTGQPVHDVEVFHKPNPGPIQSKNSHASPTPILEGDRVYLHYGAHGTACLATDGRILWKTQLKYYHRHGPGGSPILYDDLLIISCDGYDEQFVVALDKRTGRTRWKRYRDGQQAYSTPLLIHVGGQPQVLSTGGNRVVAYHPKGGQEIWSLRYDGFSLVPRPVYGHGLVFICSGYYTPLLYAVRPDGHDDVTGTHVAWSLGRSIPLTPSPLLVGDQLYFVSDMGVASCVDARTGKLRWRRRLGGDFSASPVYADRRIYFLNEQGVTTVLAPGTVFRKLATNKLNGRTLASMAASGRAFYLRTDSHLYRIEELQGKGR